MAQFAANFFCIVRFAAIVLRVKRVVVVLWKYYEGADHAQQRRFEININKCCAVDDAVVVLSLTNVVVVRCKGHFEAYLQSCDPGPTCSPF